MRAARSVLTTQQIGMGGVTVPESQSREGNLLASALTRARWLRTEDWLDLFELIVGLCVPLALSLTAQKSRDRREEDMLIIGTKIISRNKERLDFSQRRDRSHSIDQQRAAISSDDTGS